MQAIDLKMLAALHHLEHTAEQLEVVTLGGDQWVVLEERQHNGHQVGATLHSEAPQRTFVIVMPVVPDQRAHLEEVPKDLQGELGRFPLCNRELMLDLPAESAHTVAYHADRETAFAVDEPDDPLLETWPFLLIVRTGRIFTAHHSPVRSPCDPR